MATATQIAAGTQVKNISGGSRYFGFLGEKGRNLANNEIVVMPGVWPGSILADNRRNVGDYNAAVAAIAAGRVKVVSAPSTPAITDATILTVRVDSGTVIAVGDLLYLDTDDAKPAASFTWNTDLATTQAGFANVFLGRALDAHAAGVAGTVRVDTSPLSVANMTCVSQTLEIGKLLGPAKQSGNALENQILNTAVAAGAIARSTIYSAGAVTTVPVTFASAYSNLGANLNSQIG